MTWGQQEHVGTPKALPSASRGRARDSLVDADFDLQLVIQLGELHQQPAERAGCEHQDPEPGTAPAPPAPQTPLHTGLWHVTSTPVPKRGCCSPKPPQGGVVLAAGCPEQADVAPSKPHLCCCVAASCQKGAQRGGEEAPGAPCRGTQARREAWGQGQCADTSHRPPPRRDLPEPCLPPGTRHSPGQQPRSLPRISQAVLQLQQDQPAGSPSLPGLRLQQHPLEESPQIPPTWLPSPSPAARSQRPT